MDLGLRSLGSGARPNKNPGGIDSAAERPREKIRAACGKFRDPCRGRNGGAVAQCGAGGDSDRHDCQDQANADRRGSRDCINQSRGLEPDAGSDSNCDDCQDQSVADDRTSRDSINESRGLEPDARSNRQRGARCWFARAEAQNVSDDSTENESALRRVATKTRNPVADACDPDRHYHAGTSGERHARFAHDQSDDQDPAVTLHPAAADPHAGTDSTHNAGPACGCGDHSSHHPADCVHTAGETPEPWAPVRSANPDSCWNDGHGTATRSA
jgi:hypothetical protein